MSGVPSLRSVSGKRYRIESGHCGSLNEDVQVFMLQSVLTEIDDVVNATRRGVTVDRKGLQLFSSLVRRLDSAGRNLGRMVVANSDGSADVRDALSGLGDQLDKYKAVCIETWRSVERLMDANDSLDEMLKSLPKRLKLGRER